MQRSLHVRSNASLAVALVSAALVSTAPFLAGWTAAAPAPPRYHLLQAGGVNPAALKELKNAQIRQLQRAGINVEQEKEQAVGQQAASRANLYYDPADEEIYVYAPGAEPVRTGLKLGGAEVAHRRQTRSLPSRQTMRHRSRPLRRCLQSLSERFARLPEVGVRFAVAGELDPEQVTRILGVEPSDSGRRGERIMTASRVVPVEDQWSLRFPNVETLDATPVLEQGVVRLEPLAARLRQVTGLYPKAALYLTLVVFVTTRVPGAAAPTLTLSPGLLRRLANLGVRFALDYWLLAPDDEDGDVWLPGAIRAD